MEREKRTQTKLIAPVRFHDGEHFPEEARAVQSLDLTPFASALPAFWSSQSSLLLEEKVKELARSVKKIVDSAPPYQTNWQVIEQTAPPAPKIELARL